MVKKHSELIIELATQIYEKSAYKIKKKDHVALIIATWLLDNNVEMRQHLVVDKL